MKALFASVAWSNTAGMPWTIASMEQIAADLRAWLLDVSYGKVDLQCTVTPWLRVTEPDTCSCPQGFQLRWLVDAQLKTLGIDQDFFERRYYVTPHSSGCAPKGFSNGWINCGGSAYAPFALLHETGHMLNLRHPQWLRVGVAGNTVTFPAPSAELSGDYRRQDEKDSSTPMGYDPTFCHCSAPEKAAMGWITPAVYLGGDQTYTLTPMSVPGGAVYAVKVPTTTPRTYWVEYRQAVGRDDILHSDACGMQIRVTGGIVLSPPLGYVPTVIDAPRSEWFRAGFAVGQNFTDGVIDIAHVAPGVVRIRPAGAVIVAPPVVTQTTGNTQMLIDEIKAAGSALVLGQITAAQKANGMALWSQLVADAGTAPAPGDSPSGTSVPPAASITALGGVWTLGTGANPPILKDGKQASNGRADKILWQGGTMYALTGGSAWYRWDGAKWSGSSAP